MTHRFFHVRARFIAPALICTVAGLAGCIDKSVTEQRIVNDPRAITPLENPGCHVDLPTISHKSMSEAELVKGTITHRTLYARYLRVLATYYHEHGYDEKSRWARLEYTDLQDVTPYRYVADGPVPIPAGDVDSKVAGPVCSLEYPAGFELPEIEVADRHEVDLVEELIYHRTLYARYLHALASAYAESGKTVELEWALNELNGLQFVKPYRYIREAITPVATLRPTDSIPEADRLYEEGLDLMKKGGHHQWLAYDQDIMKLALAKFKALIYTYPTSDKIDDAAFYIAEIHKEYFEENDNGIAALWYKRSLDWDPETPHPVRFQLAVLLDYRLHEREEALDWYQEVIDKEADVNWSKTQFAKARIRQLTSSSTRHAPGTAIPGAAEAGSGMTGEQGGGDVIEPAPPMEPKPVDEPTSPPPDEPPPAQPSGNSENNATERVLVP